MKRRHIAWFVMVVCLVALTRCGMADDYTDRLLFADGLYARNMADLALKEYAAILKAFPDGEQNDAAAFRLAECLRLKGDTATAGRFYSHVVVTYRQSAFRLRAAYRRARLYVDEGDLDSAIAHFRVILEEKPDPDLAAAAQYYLAEVLLKKGESDAADAAFAVVQESYTDSEFGVYALVKRAELRRDRWAALFKAGDPSAKVIGAEATLFFEKALARQGSDRISAECLFQMAEIKFRQGEFEKSADLYRQLLTRFPADERSTQAMMQAAWSAINAGLYAEALAVAEKALTDPEKASVHDEWLYIKANCERQLLQYENSIRTYRELIARYPSSRFVDAVRYEMAVLHYKAGAYDQAVVEAEKIRITPALRADVCWLLAESYAALKFPSEATQYYRIVVREMPGTDRARDAMYRLAHQLQLQSAYREASRFYLDLVAQFPRDELAPQALFASAFCLAQMDSYDEAVRDWRRLTQEYSEDALAEDALYQKAMGEIRLERRADATSSLVDLLRLYPKSRFRPDAYYWQGMMLYGQEKYAEAEPALRQAQQEAVRDDLRREAMFQLGLVLQKLNQPEASAKLLQELVATPMSGKFPPALLEWLASFHGEHKDYDRMLQTTALLTQVAEPAWQQAGWVLTGRAQQACNRPAEAEAAFKKALETGVATHYAAEASLQLGSLALARNAGVEAERFFRQASEKASGEDALAIRARAFMGLGRTALLAGSNEDASRYFLSVAILYDDAVLVPESLYLAAEAFNTLQRLDDRNKVVKELGERYPESEWAGKARAAWPI